MPKPPSTAVSDIDWEVTETKEMEQLIQFYGKTFHLWQVDRGDELPLGTPQLMTSITADTHRTVPDFWDKVKDRDRRLGSKYEQKKEVRKGMKEPEIHPGMFFKFLEEMI